MKNLIFLFLSVLCFLNCSENITENNKNHHNDTIVFANGYSAILNSKNELVKIVKNQKEDSVILFFYKNQIRSEIKNSNENKKYFISNKNGLYKIKQYISPAGIKFYQNQIIYIDTLSSNFMLDNRSDYINIDGLKDTFLVNEIVKVKINAKNEVFPNFKIYIKHTDSVLDFDYIDVLKSADFNNKGGYIDELKFVKKGTYFYQGFVENYSILNKEKASLIHFFKKRIYIK